MGWHVMVLSWEKQLYTNRNQVISLGYMIHHNHLRAQEEKITGLALFAR